MHNVSTKVFVREIIENKKITIQSLFPVSLVDFEFTQVGNDATYVVIKNYGFLKSGDDLINIIRDATGGYTTVLDRLKAYLEHGFNLNLIADKFPKEVIKKQH